jgi:hypothetical protein
MTTMNHIIKQQTLSLELPPGTDTWKMQDKFREALYSDVLPRLEKVCNELGFGKDVTIRLDQLTLDLGTISKPNLNMEWADRVEKCFREELTKHKQEKSTLQSVATPSSPQESELSTLLYFLEKGAMPWWVSESHNESPQATIKKLLKEQSSALVSQIKKLQNKAAVARRIQLQFDKTTVDELLQLFDKPSVHKALSWLSRQINNLESKPSGDIQNELSLARIRSTIDPDAFQGSDQKLFKSIFKAIQKLHNNESSRILNQIRERLITETATNKANRTAGTFHSSLAIQVLNQLVDNQSKTREPTASETETKKNQLLNEDKLFKGADGAPGDHKGKASVKSSSPDQQQAAQDTGSQQHFQKQVEDASGDNKSADQSAPEADKPTTDQASSQDQRVWEHIERIKKQQLAQLLAEDHKTTGKNQGTEEDPLDKVNVAKQPIQDDLRQKPSQTAPANEVKESNPANSNLTEAHKPRSAKHEHQTDEPAHLADEKKTSPQSGSSGDTHNSQQDQENTRDKAADHHRSSPEQDSLEYWQEELETLDECYVQNAGLILFWPYLGHFFKDLGLVADGTFRSAAHQRRAALILQHLAEDQPELHEYKLPLNKLMAGLPISEPVQRHIELSEADMTKCRNLLEATISNWPALKGTSVPGFQSSFIKRNGLLKRHDSHWQLQVEKMPFDMLMEQLPWPISIVRLSWMKKPIYVEW